MNQVEHRDSSSRVEALFRRPGAKNIAVQPLWYAETVSVIAAPLGDVWQTIVDVHGWHRWGNFLPFRSRGPLVEGDAMALGFGRRGWIVVPLARWLVVRPADTLCWGGGIPGLHIRHWVMLEEIAPDVVRVRHGEGVHGAAARVLPGFLRRPYGAILGLVVNRGLERRFGPHITG